MSNANETLTHALSTEQREYVEEFLHLEAELADHHRYEDWLALWEPARALYHVPYTPPRPDAPFTLSVIRDDYERMQERFDRLRSGDAHAQDPPSRLVRVLNRVRAWEDLGSQTILADANFFCFESRPTRDVVWAGTYHYTLGRAAEDGTLLIYEKRVDLVNVDRPLPNLTFLI